MNPLKVKTKFFMTVLTALLFLSIASLIYTYIKGPFSFDVIHLPYFVFGFHFDFLSSLILSNVYFLSCVIFLYSFFFLKEEKKYLRFNRFFLLTIFFVSSMILSTNLIQFFMMWMGTSWGLHHLLLFYSNNHEAIMAAKKKFFVSRIGDLSLFIAIYFSFQIFGTFDFQKIFQQINTDFVSQNQSTFSLISFFFVLGAMTKSAQFPFHFWLPETMNAPTPVSAFMHAGIINAGGFLIVRLNPIIQHGLEAQILLILFGSITAVFGSLVMMTQNHLKKKLAYSTVSQMGMMMLACGIGAYSLAVFHIIAHSLYKAYSFLSTGMQVEESKIFNFLLKKKSPLSFCLTLTISLSLIIYSFLIFQNVESSYLFYFGILFLGFFQNREILLSKDLSFFLILKILFSIFVFLLLEFFLKKSLEPLISYNFAIHDYEFLERIFFFLSYLIFLFGFYLDFIIIEPKSKFEKKVYFYFWNEGYFPHFSDLLILKINNLFKK